MNICYHIEYLCHKNRWCDKVLAVLTNTLLVLSREYHTSFQHKRNKQTEMVLSIEAESLAREAEQAEVDAKKAQARLAMLKARYGMLKDEASLEPTVETRGTESVRGDEESETRMEAFVENTSPLPPPPPRTIVKKVRARTAPATAPTPPPPQLPIVQPREVETMNVSIPVPALAQPQEVVAAPVPALQPPAPIAQTEISEAAPLVRQEDIVTAPSPAPQYVAQANTPPPAPVSQPLVQQSQQRAAMTPSSPTVSPVFHQPVRQVMQPATSLPVTMPQPVAPQEVISALVPAPESMEPVITPQQPPTQEFKEKKSSMFKFQTPSFLNAERILDSLLGDSVLSSEPPVFERTSPGVPLRAQSQSPIQESMAAPTSAPMTAPMTASMSPQMHQQMHPQMHPQMSSPMYPQMHHHTSMYAPMHSPAPVGMAMPTMADAYGHHSPPSGAYYHHTGPMMRPAEHFAAPAPLHPIGELEQRVAAIPETRDDFPAAHPMESNNFGSYYADDVSVLTEFHYAKPAVVSSPRQFQQTILEEGSVTDDAPAALILQKTNSVEAAQPRASFAPAPTPLYQLVDRPGHRAPSPAQVPQPMSTPRRPLDAPEVQTLPRVEALRKVTAQPPAPLPMAPPKQQADRNPNRVLMTNMPPEHQRKQDAPEVISVAGSVNGDASIRNHKSRAAPLGYRAPYAYSPIHEGVVHTGPYIQQQHRYVTTRSGAASAASYHRENFGSGASVASYHHPPRTRFAPPSSGASVVSQQHYYGPSGAASVAPSMGDNSIISVRTNARGRKVVTKLVKVDEENETNPVVKFFDKIRIDKLCGIEFDEQYAVVEEELPAEPLAPTSVARSTATGKKVFNENNYADPFAGKHDDMSLCGLL